MHRLHLPSARIFLLLFACGGEGDSDGTGTSADSATHATATSTSGPTTSSTGDALPAGCECLASECGPFLCTVVVEAGCPDQCPTDFTVDEAALTCALTALRDGTPGTVSWHYTPTGGGVEENGSTSILADRAAIRSDSYSMIICGGQNPTVRGQLFNAEHFDACLADPSAQNRFDCLRGPVSAVDITCVPGSQSCGDDF